LYSRIFDRSYYYAVIGNISGYGIYIMAIQKTTT
jgi:hypothetical protein